MQGFLNVIFERQGEKTVAREIRQRVPLRALRPLYPEGEAPAHLYVLNATGGILEGDQMEISLRLEKGSRVLMTTPAATRVYTMPSGEARQKMALSLGPGAILEYWPEPLLLYAGAAFCQETDIFLDEGAILFFTDLLAPGRLARGESFAFRLFENRLKVYDREGLLFQESFCLRPLDRLLNALGVMEEYTHLGSLYLFCSEGERERLLTAFRETEAQDLSWGATLLMRRGLVVRALGHQTPAIQDFFLSFGPLFGRG